MEISNFRWVKLISNYFGIDKSIIFLYFPSFSAHQNTKLFISHAGLLSFTETIHYGVPILAMPVFAEQKLNAIFAEEQGLGIQLSLLDLTEENFGNALNELIENPK